MAGGTVSTAGNNVLVTPATGSRLVLSYLMYNPEVDMRVFWRTGATGMECMKTNVPANSVIARGFDADIGWALGVNESLNLNLSTAGNVNYTVFYTEELG